LENEGVNCEHTQVKKNNFNVDDQMYNNCKSAFFNVSYSLHPKNNVMKAKKSSIAMNAKNILLEKGIQVVSWSSIDHPANQMF